MALPALGAVALSLRAGCSPSPVGRARTFSLLAAHGIADKQDLLGADGSWERLQSPFRLLTRPCSREIPRPKAAGPRGIRQACPLSRSFPGSLLVSLAAHLLPGESFCPTALLCAQEPGEEPASAGGPIVLLPGSWG